MAIAIGILLKVLYVLSALATMLLGVTFNRASLRRFPWLGRFRGKQAQLFLIAAGCVVVALPLELVSGALKVVDEQRRADLVLERVRAVLGEAAVPKEAGGNLVTIQSDRLSAALSLAIRSEESYQSGKYQEALSFLKEADQLVSIAPIKARIADCFFQLDDYVKAIAFEQQAIALAPEWSGPYYVVGISYLRLGRSEDGREALQKSCELGFDVACEALR